MDRRTFLAGSAAALAAGSAAARNIFDGASPAQRSALDAIARHLDEHRAHFGLPAMGMVVVDGPQQFFILSGTRDHEGRQPLALDDLWQIGSISKSVVAAACLQIESEGKWRLDDELRDHLPDAPLPGVTSGGPFTLRGLLDHTTGLPDFAPAFPSDGSRLWRGFAAGSHWSYSNTGYNLVGAALERKDGKPLYAVLEDRVLKPLGMTASRGAIQWRDRPRYPASFAPLRPDFVITQRNALAPAAWVDASLGAGSVAATLPDMAHYLRFLIGVGSGAGGPVLSSDQAAAWLARPVVQDRSVAAETYGLGLMHRQAGGHRLLHHTGGMVSFSSSFHTDSAAGVGAFASCAIGMTGYRPRLLTRYACEAMRAAKEGKPLPPPPPLASPIVKLADYPGTYRDGARTLTVSAAGTVTIGGQPAPLEAAGPPDQLVTTHPALAQFPLQMVREAGQVAAIDHGATRWFRDGVAAPPLPDTPPRIAARAGHYQSDDAWIGGVTLVARGDTLWVGGTEPLIEIADDVWRVKAPDWNPERLRFAGHVDGVPQVLVASGHRMERRAL